MCSEELRGQRLNGIGAAVLISKFAHGEDWLAKYCADTQSAQIGEQLHQVLHVALSILAL